MAKERIDKLLVERGFVETRARAQAIILAGQVLVNEQRVDKAGQMVDAAAEIRIKGETLRYVGRGGLKLESALREFGVSPAGKICLDVGASTGGFTDCLLQHGAERVWAVDVGHNQLAWRIRSDPRVSVMEGVNARDLESCNFPVKFDLATVDVSFISLDKVLPSLAHVISPSADVIALVKPQFEVGKGEVGKKGIVTDPKKHRQALKTVLVAAATAGFQTIRLIPSPILGAEGNREFLAHLRPEAASLPTHQSIDEMIEKAASS